MKLLYDEPNHRKHGGREMRVFSLAMGDSKVGFRLAAKDCLACADLTAFWNF